MSTRTRTVLREAVVNATAGHMIGDYDSPIEDTILADDHSAGALYRFGVSEYGRCVGKVYVDTDSGTEHIGYVFHARRRYEDVPETYLHETWLTLERVTSTDDGRETHRTVHLNRARVPRLEDEPMRAPMRPAGVRKFKLSRKRRKTP